MTAEDSGWTPIAAIPGERYGQASLSVIARIALAFGYAMDDIDIGTLYTDDMPWILLSVPNEADAWPEPLTVAFDRHEPPPPPPAPQLALPAVPEPAPAPTVPEPAPIPPRSPGPRLPQQRVCPACTRRFETIGLMHGHFKNLHTEGHGKQFQCDECPQIWDSHKGMAMHRSREHGSRSDAASQTDDPAERAPGPRDRWDRRNPMLACASCDFYCATAVALNNHCQRVHNRVPTVPERTPLSQEATDERLRTESAASPSR